MHARGRKAAIVETETVVTLGQQALIVVLLVSAPMLLSGMIIGLLISVFQSVTQIQEITLTFVPKILVVMLSFLVFLPFMMSQVIQIAERLLGGFNQYVF